jgi:hypothetical protein
VKRKPTRANIVRRMRVVRPERPTLYVVVGWSPDVGFTLSGFKTSREAANECIRLNRMDYADVVEIPGDKL